MLGSHLHRHSCRRFAGAWLQFHRFMETHCSKILAPQASFRTEFLLVERLLVGTARLLGAGSLRRYFHSLWLRTVRPDAIAAPTRAAPRGPPLLASRISGLPSAHLLVMTSQVVPVPPHATCGVHITGAGGLPDQWNFLPAGRRYFKISLQPRWWRSAYQQFCAVGVQCQITWERSAGGMFWPEANLGLFSGPRTGAALWGLQNSRQGL